jgi:nucleoid DNA-binding protein
MAGKKPSVPTEKMTKSQIAAHIAETTGLTRKQVSAVFSTLQELAKVQLSKRGPGEFPILPGMVKAKIRTKAAVKAGKWINPFTKQEEMRKAKPARRVVRFSALKTLKDSIV